MYRKIITAAAVLFIVFTFTTCKTINQVLQEPRVSLHSVEMTKIDFTGTELLCKIQVDNPNAVNIPFPEVGWELFINNNSFIKGVVKNNQRIGARTATLIDVPVKFNHIDFFRSFQSLMGEKQSAYRVALDTKFSLPVIGDKTWRFEHRGDIPLLQFLTLRAPTMKIDHIDLTKAEILFTANVDNPNPFNFPAVKMAYDYHVNRNSFIKGSAVSATPLHANSVTPISFRFPVNYADLFRSFQSLRSSNEAASMLYLTFDFSTTVFGNDTFKLEIPGVLPLPRL